MRAETESTLPQELGALKITDQDSQLTKNGLIVARSIKTAKPAPPEHSSSFRRKRKDNNPRNANNHVDEISKQMVAAKYSPQETGKVVAKITGFNGKK